MKRFTIRHLPNLSFGVAVLILISLGVFAVVNLGARVDSENRVDHTLIVQGKLKATLALLTDAETGALGYVITGEDLYLEPYNAALTPSGGVSQDLQELRQLTSDNPNQQKRLDVLDALVAENLALLRKTIDLRKTGGFAAGQAMVLTEQGARALDGIRQVIAQMENEEGTLLKQRSAITAAQTQATRLIVATGTLASLLLLAVAYYFVNREVGERRRAENTLHQLNDELDQRVEEQTAQLAGVKKTLESILASAGEGIYGVDADGKTTFANPALAKMLGRETDELIGQSMHTLAHHTKPDGRPYPAEECPIYATIHDGNSHHVDDEVFWRKDGTSFPVEYTSSPIREGGTLAGAVVVTRDFTERRQAEEQLRRTHDKLDAILQASPVAILTIDPAGRILSWNKGAETMFGWTEQEAVGRVCPTVPETGLEDFHQMIARGLAGESFTGYIKQRQKKDGQLIEASIAFAPLPDGHGKPAGIVAILDDITERRQADEQIRRNAARAESMVRAAARLNAEMELEPVLNTVCEETARALAVPIATVSLYDATQKHLVLTASFGLTASLPESIQSVPRAVLDESNLAASTIVVTPDVQALPNLPNADRYAKMNLRTTASVNMLREGRLVGQLNIGTLGEMRHFTDDELALLRGLADQAAQAIAKAQLFAERTQVTEALRQLNAELEQRVTERAAELNQFFYLSLDLLAIAGTDGYFKRLNPAWQKTLGYRDEELRARPFVDFVHPDDRENTLAEAGKLAGGGYETISFDNRYRHRNGSYRWIRWSASASGGLLYAVARDNTEAKQMEAALRQAKDEAEQANRAKSEFLSRMSHELRTPLNSILGFAQLIEMDKLKPDHEKGVKHILKAGRHLLNLINEVLDISRIESGQLALSPEPVKLRGLILETLDIVRPLAEARRLTLELAEAPANDLFVRADRQRLKQVLLNLLGNAVKYNREGGHMIVACRLQKPELKSTGSVSNLQPFNYAPGQSVVRISVTDTGPGIAPENLERLFNPFERVGAEQTETEGTGLGLAIAKKLIEAMGGTLGVESVLGQGSTFWFELLWVEDQLSSSRSQSELEGILPDAARAGTVLYIEDNLPNLQLMEQIFTRRPAIRLVTTLQGRLGFALAREHQPDLILLDLNLPDMHGTEVLRLLRAEPKTRAIPVVVISADATSGQIKQLEAAGVQNYLTKPLDVRQFLELLDKILEAQRAK